MNIIVFRYGHRIFRDKRISTHCALVSRAFGASKMYYSGQEDNSMQDNVTQINKKWGSNFSIEYINDPISFLNEKKENGYKIIHLTMYGLIESKFVKKYKNELGEKILIIIGGEKVPNEIYHISDYNVSITNQPHSEVAALTIILDRISKNYENLKFMGKINLDGNIDGIKRTL